MLNIKLPLWYQVAQSLRADIISRPADDLRLPTERDLAAQYDVSLITVRQALKSIEEEGLITRHRRRGTFINPDAITSRPLELLGSLDAVIAQQTSETSEVLERSVITVPEQFEDQFGPGAKVVKFRRLRHDDGEVRSYAVNYVREKEGLQVRSDQLQTAPMTRILREMGVRLHRVQDTVEARLADAEVAELVGLEIGSPILYFIGTTFDANDRVVDIACICYRGDRYRFAVGFDVD
ncbi:GntR family transcriptional regulator [Nocardia nova]|uniref:GntR family transcriptional regulator n=1 Tax=Nocardia nova TaxID=37330 RepID=UPI0033C36202